MEFRTLPLALALSAISLPASADTIFLGRLLYTKAENCAQQRAGTLYSSTYMPSGLPGNGDRTIISETYDVGGHSYVLAKGRFTAGFKTVTDLSHGQGVGTGTARVRITRSEPADADIDADTEFVWLAGQFETPQGDPGLNGKKCLMSFTATYVRK